MSIDQTPSFTAPTPPAFTPPQAPPIEGNPRNGDPLDADRNGVLDVIEDETEPAPNDHARGLGVTGKFPEPHATSPSEDQ